MRTTSTFRLAVMALTLAGPALASAQTAGARIDISDLKVKPGDTVWVSTDAGGERKGKLTAMTPLELSFETDGKPVTVAFSSIRRIERPDPILNGLVIGAMAGFGGGFVVALGTGYFGGADESPDAGAGMGIAARYAAIGAAVGTVLDAALGQRKTVYRSGQTSLTLAPAVARGGASMGVRIRW